MNEKLSRLQANQQILAYLWRFFGRNPDLRFHQGLCGLDIIEGTSLRFYEESDQTLKQVARTYDLLHAQNPIPGGVDEPQDG